MMALGIDRTESCLEQKCESTGVKMSWAFSARHRGRCRLVANFPCMVAPVGATRVLRTNWSWHLNPSP